VNFNRRPAKLKTPAEVSLPQQQPTEQQMTSMVDHLNQVSIFNSALALFVILGFSWAFTLIHVLQEWKGEAVPVWRVFGAIVGVWIPNRLGFALFTLTLTVIEWAVSLAAITGWPIVGSLGMPAAAGALGVLMGARVGDSVVSHWGLYALGYRPNPGLSSTVLYVAETVFILSTFWKGLSPAPGAAWVGIAIGVLFFCLVLPTLRCLRLIPGWRREQWARGQPLPSWAKD
jgi:hypothetical protein